MRNVIAIGIMATSMLAACGNSAGSNDAATVIGPEAPEAPGSCPDDGGRLPITGICAARAANYLNVAGGTPPDAPEGCEWTVQETRFADDVLLYRATRCGRKTTRLAFAGGAGLAELSYDTAGYGDAENTLKGQVIVRIAGVDPADKTATLLRVARDAIDDPAQKTACSVRNAGQDFWPSDALVVDVSAAEAAKAPEGEPRTACGPFGLDQDSSAFWRVFQGHSWFFQLGQDAWQVDPGSFTLMRKGKNGAWSQAE